MNDEETSIPYSNLSGCPEWIGRNGKFKAKAMRLRSLNGERKGIIQIMPEGQKGLAKNALIEFPVEAIPQITNWLLAQRAKLL